MVSTDIPAGVRVQTCARAIASRETPIGADDTKAATRGGVIQHHIRRYGKRGLRTAGKDRSDNDFRLHIVLRRVPKDVCRR